MGDKMRVLAAVTPQTVFAQMRRKMAEPGPGG